MDRIRKIPLESLIDLLTSLYDKGVDFVDIHGKASEEDENEDVIVVGVTEEYINEEYIESFNETMQKLQEEETEEKPIKIEKFSDKDINNLI